MSKYYTHTPESIAKLVENTIGDLVGNEAVMEAKQYDVAHGAKLSHKILTDFFKNSAPKYNSLAAVEAALHALYKQNNIETTTQGVKQVISNAKKKFKIVESEELEEATLTAKEKVKKDKVVLQLKKDSKIFRDRFKDKEKANLELIANAIVKNG